MKIGAIVLKPSGWTSMQNGTYQYAMIGQAELTEGTRPQEPRLRAVRVEDAMVEQHLAIQLAHAIVHGDGLARRIVLLRLQGHGLRGGTRR